jgi:hypothetical protein
MGYPDLLHDRHLGLAVGVLYPGLHIPCNAASEVCSFCLQGTVRVFELL